MTDDSPDIPSAASDDAPQCIRMAAVGDLLLSRHGQREPAEIFAGVREAFAGCDVVFGNLECTLVGDGETVPTEPRVISTPELIRAVPAGGFSVVTLANNHMFDCMPAGFHETRELVESLGVAHFGAGDTLAEASAPAMLEVAGLRLAFVAAVDERSGPSGFATEDGPGVAPLDMQRLTDQIRDLREQADHVIVSIHWGEERLAIPSPVQVEQARAMVDAGASMVLGHHPHVLQGLETWNGRPIIYSLGNFAADDVHYTDGDTIHWSRTERTGCILLLKLTKTDVRMIGQTPTYDPGDAVVVDESGFGEKRIEKVNRALARGVTLKRYRREHLRVKTIKPILAHLRWSELRRIRPRHFWNGIHSLLNARGAR